MSELHGHDRRIRKERVVGLGVGPRRERVHGLALRLVLPPREADLAMRVGQVGPGNVSEALD